MNAVRGLNRCAAIDLVDNGFDSFPRFFMFHYLCDFAAITNKKSELLTCESASHLRSLHGADEAVNSSGSSCYIFTSNRLY